MSVRVHACLDEEMSGPSVKSHPLGAGGLGFGGRWLGIIGTGFDIFFHLFCSGQVTRNPGNHAVYE